MVGGRFGLRSLWVLAIFGVTLGVAATAQPQLAGQDWLDKGYALRQPNGDYSPPELAAYYFSKAVAASPRNAAAFAVLAQVYLQLQQYEDVIKALDQAIRLEPRVASHYVMRSQALLALHQSRDACTDLSKACELGDQNACGQSKGRC